MMSKIVFGASVGAVMSFALVGDSKAAAPSLNLAGALADTKAILAGGGQADVVVLGDSLSFRTGSYLPVFRDLLQSHYGNAGAGYQGMSLWSGVGLNNGWRRQGVDMDMSPHHSLDGLWVDYDGHTAWPNQAEVTVVDRTVQVQYMTQPDGGSFEIRNSSNGDPAATISTAGPSGQVRTYSHTLPAGNTQYFIQPMANGPLTLLGENNTRTDPGIRVHRAANGGWGVDNFIRRDATFDTQLSGLGTDLVMVFLGQNDQAYTRSTYDDRLNLLIDRIQADAPLSEVVLIGTYDQGATPLAGLVEAMADVAQSRGVGFINLYGTAGDSNFFNSNGFLDDGVHFSPAGGAYVGNLLYNAFLTNGSSLVPEPSMIALALPFVGMLRRRR